MVGPHSSFKMEVLQKQMTSALVVAHLKQKCNIFLRPYGHKQANQCVSLVAANACNCLYKSTLLVLCSNRLPTSERPHVSRNAASYA